MTDRVTFEISWKTTFRGLVTSEPMVAFSSDGQVLYVPAGTPFPEMDCITVHSNKVHTNED